MKIDPSLIISILALLFSLFTWVHHWYERRFRIEFKIIDYETKSDKDLFFVRVDNLSDRPCSITSIHLKCDENWISCELEPIRAKSQRGYDCLSASFPIYLSSRGGQSFYIWFLTDRECPLRAGRTVTFKIYSPMKFWLKSTTLQSQSHYCRASNWTF